MHEVAHSVAELALRTIDPLFDADLATAFAHARATGSWARTYAGTSEREYWAEGVQSYFNVDREGPVDGDGQNNDVNTRAELEIHDPLLFGLIGRIYGEAGL